MSLRGSWVLSNYPTTLEGVAFTQKECLCIASLSYRWILNGIHLLITIFYFGQINSGIITHRTLATKYF